MAAVSRYALETGLRQTAARMSRSIMIPMARQVAGNERSGKSQLWRTVIKASTTQDILHSGWHLYAER